MELFSIWKLIKNDFPWILLVLFLLLMILVTALVVKNECKCDAEFINNDIVEYEIDPEAYLPDKQELMIRWEPDQT